LEDVGVEDEDVVLGLARAGGKARL
jgi:hypothetical protein